MVSGSMEIRVLLILAGEDISQSSGSDITFKQARNKTSMAHLASPTQRSQVGARHTSTLLNHHKPGSPVTPGAWAYFNMSTKPMGVLRKIYSTQEQS